MSDASAPPARVSWFGDRAVMVSPALAVDRAALLGLLAAALPDRQVRAGMATVLVEAAEPDPGLLDAVVHACGTGAWPGVQIDTSRLVTVPVAYTGEDLGAAAGALDCSESALIAAHQAQDWRVAMMGFAPGFGYLVPDGASVLDWAALPRRSTPRAAVPRGSVAIAAGMCAVYPSAMPGGWHLIGMTDAIIFDAADEAHPSLLVAGDLVRFRGATS
ncbi:MAG: carboxyltransferase domain-containing protein [Actinobacteria bacterium]|nr:carboxyltransferase domain-containing protein [Actinomycetota bacterium]